HREGLPERLHCGIYRTREQRVQDDVRFRISEVQPLPKPCLDRRTDRAGADIRSQTGLGQRGADVAGFDETRIARPVAIHWLDSRKMADEKYANRCKLRDGCRPAVEVTRSQRGVAVAHQTMRLRIVDVGAALKPIYGARFDNEVNSHRIQAAG